MPAIISTELLKIYITNLFSILYLKLFIFYKQNKIISSIFKNQYLKSICKLISTIYALSNKKRKSSPKSKNKPNNFK